MGREYYTMTASPKNLDGPVSKSLLWDFCKSPFKWINAEEREQTDNMLFGSLVHALCFSPKQVADEYVVAPYDDWRTKEAREWKQTQADAGKAAVKEADLQRAEDMKESIMESEYIFGLGACDYEVAAFGQIGETIIKGMIDILPRSGNKLVDLKTTNSLGTENDLKRLIKSFGYHWQAALYLDLVNGLTGQSRTEFEFLFVETSFPYETAVVGLSENFIQQGREGYMNAVAKWQDAVSTKKFLPLHPFPLVIDAPAYA